MILQEGPTMTIKRGRMNWTPEIEQLFDYIADYIESDSVKQIHDHAIISPRPYIRNTEGQVYTSYVIEAALDFMANALKQGQHVTASRLEKWAEFYMSVRHAHGKMHILYTEPVEHAIGLIGEHITSTGVQLQHFIHKDKFNKQLIILIAIQFTVEEINRRKKG